LQRSKRAIHHSAACAPIIPKAGTDLFGAWLVDLVYGRLGTRGWRICYVVNDKDEARKLMRRSLRRRATTK
jgi:hypothetical protein